MPSVLFPMLLLFAQAAVAAPSAGAERRVTLNTPDGWALVGTFREVQAPQPVPAVLLLHGAARDRRAYTPLADALARRGVASLRLDLRGEGESTNKGRFDPASPSAIIAETHRDVAAALEWLRRQSGIDPKRLGVVGASYSGEAMADAARRGASASAYVALSPGSFSDDSVRAIDASGHPWWFIASSDERFANAVVTRIPTMSRTARVTIVAGTSHASDILSPHFLLNAEIADWFAATFAARTAPEGWGGLQPGPFDVGFGRSTIDTPGGRVVLDAWYPARGGKRMAYGDYLRLSTDLRGATAQFPRSDGALRETLSAAVSGGPVTLPEEAASRMLSLPMAATLDAAPAGARFPLVLWTPRYATTAAQAVLSEYLASRGFIVAFARPERGGRLPFEAPDPAAKREELRARVADMRAALAHLQQRPNVDATRIGVLAWSYTGEMAVRFQLEEPRVALVTGLSTNLLSGWVFDPEALAAFDTSRLTATYALLAEAGGVRPSPALPSLAYLLEFPGLAHGSFNALEGYLPSRLGVRTVQPWSDGSDATSAGYEAAALIVGRLLQHHVAVVQPRPAPRVALLSSIPSSVAGLADPASPSPAASPGTRYLQARTRVMQAGATAADLDRVMDLLTEDAVYEHPAFGARIAGRAAIRKGMEGQLGSARGATSVVDSRTGLTGSEAVRERLSFEARNKDGWTPVSRRQLLIFEYKDGRISRILEYWDR